MFNFSQDFLLFAHQQQALKFGEFITKAGRVSPYFFNAGLFNDGQSLHSLAKFYAKTIIASELEFDMLFGPAYKGITLAAATAMALAEQGRNVPFAFNRKEIKDHGEGGNLVGAPLQGRVLIIDDVISAGTSVRESMSILHENHAQAAGVVVALDRMEVGQNSQLSAIEEVKQQFKLPVLSVSTLDQLIDLIEQHEPFKIHLPAMAAYRSRYGLKDNK